MVHHINSDLSVEVYDYITADQDISEGDQVYVFTTNDPIEVKEKWEEGDTIVLRGYSYKSGDMETYFLTFDTEVGLWTA
jgi:hypothetical protein